MEVLSKAADMISDADSISKLIYSEADYSLMPTYAVVSSVAPAFLMSAAGMVGGLNFPKWLGQNSSRTKNNRLIREMHSAMSLVAPSPLTSFIVDYMPALRSKLVDPFRGPDPAEVVEDVIGELESLGLVKEDWDTLVEVTDPFARLADKTLLATTVKSKFTREWRKRAHRMTATRGLKVDKGAAGLKAAANEYEEEASETDNEVAEGEEEAEGDDVISKKDPMIQELSDKKADSPTGRGGGGGKGGGSRGGRGRGGGSKGSRGRARRWTGWPGQGWDCSRWRWRRTRRECEEEGAQGRAE